MVILHLQSYGLESYLDKDAVKKEPLLTETNYDLAVYSEKREFEKHSKIYKERRGRAMALIVGCLERGKAVFNATASTRQKDRQGNRLYKLWKELDNMFGGSNKAEFVKEVSSTTGPTIAEGEILALIHGEHRNLRRFRKFPDGKQEFSKEFEAVWPFVRTL